MVKRFNLVHRADLCYDYLVEQNTLPTERKEIMMSEEKKMSLDAEELTEVAGGDEPDKSEPELVGKKCPSCGSKDTYYDIIDYFWHCKNCGYKWI